MKITVTPIDMSAPGSHTERKKLLRALAKIQGVQKSGQLADVFEAFESLEALVTPHLQIDDGTPVAQALEQLSAEEFDGLALALMNVETIPNPKSAG